MKPIPKDYIGDGVYVEDDGYAIVMTTENGVCAQNTIVLEPEVIAGLERYIERFKKVRA